MAFSWKTILILVAAVVIGSLIYDFVASRISSFEEGDFERLQ